MEREAAMAFIRALQKSDLALFLSEALQSRAELQDYGAGGRSLTVLCLAECSQHFQDARAEAEPLIHFLAPPADPGSVWAAMEVLEQSGTCAQCHLPVQCAAKIALCPMCGSSVPCT